MTEQLESSPDLEEILTTSNLVELEMVKSLLDSAEIPYLVSGESAVAMLPMPSLTFRGKKRGVVARLKVRPADAEVVRELLAQLEAEAPHELDADDSPA